MRKLCVAKAGALSKLQEEKTTQHLPISQQISTLLCKQGSFTISKLCHQVVAKC